MNIAFLEFKYAGEMHYEANRMGSADAGQSKRAVSTCSDSLLPLNLAFRVRQLAITPQVGGPKQAYF